MMNDIHQGGLDPDCQSLLSAVNSSRAPAIHQLPIEAARSAFKTICARTAPAAPDIHRTRMVHCLDGGADIQVRFYVPRPDETEAAPLIMFVHGGGWVLGDLDDFDVFCRQLALGSNCRVASIGYRLAPEHPFPAGLGDVKHALAWLISVEQKHCRSPARFGVVADSAGANLVLAACQADPTLVPHSLCLIYPWLDLRMNFASHRQFGEGYLLTTKTLEWFRKQYLPAGIAPTDPAVSPLYGPKLAALKAAFVVTAGYDPLRDDGLAFVERLCAQGTSVQHLCYEGTFHGFVTMGGVLPVASDAVREIASWMGEALGVVPTK